MSYKELDQRLLSPEARIGRKRDLEGKRTSWFWHQIGAVVIDNGRDFHHAAGRIRDLDCQIRGKER